MFNILIESDDAKIQEIEKSNRQGVLATLKGEFQPFDTVGRNGRLYSEDLWENVLSDSLVREAIERGVLFGEIDHPTDRYDIRLSNISHVVTDLRVDKERKIIEGVLDVLDTPQGNILYTLIKRGCKLGVSSRGLGETRRVPEGHEVVNPKNYKFITFDVVSRPSFDSSVPEVMENVPDYSSILENAIKNCSVSDIDILKGKVEDSGVKLLIESRELELMGSEEKIEESSSREEVIEENTDLKNLMEERDFLQQNLSNEKEKNRKVKELLEKEKDERRQVVEAFETERLVLAERVNKLNEKIAEMNGIFDHRIMRKENTKLFYQKRCEGLIEQVDEVSDKLADVKESNAELEKEVKRLKRELKVKIQEVSELSKKPKISEKQGSLVEAQQKKKILQLESEKEGLESRIGRLEGEVKSYVDELSRKDILITSLTENLVQMKKVHVEQPVQREQAAPVVSDKVLQIEQMRNSQIEKSFDGFGFEMDGVAMKTPVKEGMEFSNWKTYMKKISGGLK